MKRKELEEKLQNRFFIIGGGAWQHLWEADDVKPSMGFLPEPSADVSDTPSSKQLKTSIQPELLKRFRSKVLVMNPMSDEDYKLLIPKFTELLPAMLQERFTSLCNTSLRHAVTDQLGMRYFEEILTQTLCSKSEIKNPTITK